MCEICARLEIIITDGITKEGLLYYCKGCDRYLRPPWVRCGSSLDSNEMMAMCLGKIKGLNKVKLVNSSFIWTEPHSKIIKIKLTVQKEMNKNLIETSFIVEFKVEWTQCDDCKKTFTPHIWNASVQIRQKVGHKRTFMYLEQVILKNKAHSKALNVKEHPEGVDFYFANKSQALTLADFIKTVIPAKVKQSKQLVSHDQHSNLYNYKYTFMIELAPVCKEDLIVLDKETSKNLGGIGPVVLCHKLSSKIHLVDPLTFNVCELDGNNYWRHEVKSYVDRKCLEEFLIMNVEEEIDYSKKYANKTHSTLNDVEMESAVDSKLNQSKSKNYKITNNKPHLSNKNYFNNRGHFLTVTVESVNQTDLTEAKLITTRCHLGKSDLETFSSDMILLLLT
jgi:nonsense-mediated mRNA decay protein 3